MKGIADSEDQSQITELSGRPNDSSRPGESERFAGFKKLMRRLGIWSGPIRAETASLAHRAAEAVVAKEEGEASKRAAEAAEISARTDALANENISATFDLIDLINEPGQSEEVRMLKMMALFEQKPELAKQAEKVREIMDRLRLEHGTTVEPESEEASHGVGASKVFLEAKNPQKDA